MADTFRSRNQVALVFLVVAKLLGIGGLVVGSSHRQLGGMFLGLDALFIVIAVGLCVKTMKARETEASGHKQLLKQMMQEGTLHQYLRDLQFEANATTPASPSSPQIRSI
ncbi:MAG TPA: hypothetical protein VM580_01110 [Labilithrix sp.]|nr:hypothetical protein [Labilithrix sp.]